MTTAPFTLLHLDHVVLRVADVQRMTDFYVEVLGCAVERVQHDIGLHQLRAGASLIDLVGVDGPLGRAGGAAPGASGRNVDHLCLRVDPFDADGIRAHLRAHGVEFGAVAPRYGADGTGPSIYLDDPEGNRVELKGPPDAPPTGALGTERPRITETDDMHATLRSTVAAAALAAGVGAAAAPDAAEMKKQVFAAERAFAKTMADRDLKAFGTFLSDETVFYSANPPLHGRQAVVDNWKRFYEQPQAPFSWEPDSVEVIASAGLAYSSGPVRDPSGKVVARFNTVWRQEAPGVWRVLFDKGEPVCPPPDAKK